MKIQLITTLVAAALASTAVAEGDAAAGQAKAQQICAACHGADGNSSNPEWPNLAGQHARYIAKQLADYKAGEQRNNAVMAGFVAALSEEDMANLGAWFASQEPRGSTADPELAEAGERLYRGGDTERGIPACSGCHGPRGSGDPSGVFPALAGQHAQYTYTQLKAFHAAERANDPNAMMRGSARWMSDDQMRAVAEYIQGLY